MPVGTISTLPSRAMRSSSPGWTAAWTADRSAVRVKTTRPCSASMVATRSFPCGMAAMTFFNWSSVATSGAGCGATREMVLPTSSRNPLGTRSAAPTSTANTLTASRTTTVPMTNCQAQKGTNAARFIAHTPSNRRASLHICQDSAVNEPLRAVCVGGGLGAPTVMAGLRAHTPDITALIGVTDSGRSTGKVRIALDVPAPGDIRNALTVLAEGDPVLTRLMAHRFATDKSEDLNGMAFGNLFLAALTQQEGSFLRAVEEASRLLKLRGRVLPVTLYNTHLCAELTDGSIVEEEVQVRGKGKAAIKRIYLKDDNVTATPG